MPTPTLDLYQVDAFTDRPFAGNPAAVCLLPEPRDARWMQDVAREMNLSETAFLDPVEGGFNLRWFTPAIEVELCGHATLASAHVLWATGRLGAGETARFHTLSGLLTAERQGEWISLDFPARRVEAVEAPAGLLAALGAEPWFVGKSRYDYFVEVPSEDAVRALIPDFQALKSLPVRGVVVTARSSAARFDFVSRFFAPGLGVDEDPVTGSAHCTLGPYWASRLEKEDLLAYQASARGGVVKVRVEGDRVKLGGQAVMVLRGRLLDGGSS
ncbi:MAG TPA: PhzF family phenazine biosynthesis protein [Thermoanaerobaculia bacterium]|jgi:PhzF family phenazine biosynthesis protein|nr:PhzF family phenazine biosynthesis protein [Thermoanaerobaculia bacterium]